MVAIDLLDMAALRLTLAPSQHHSPVGQEHGRTIPLAVVSRPKLGISSRQATRAMQIKLGLPADSYPTAELLARMRAGR